jgi:hypothetical protein
MNWSKATPLERLLIDRIVAGWLSLSGAEATYAQQMNVMSWG